MRHTSLGPDLASEQEPRPAEAKQVEVQQVVCVLDASGDTLAIPIGKSVQTVQHLAKAVNDYLMRERHPDQLAVPQSMSAFLDTAAGHVDQASRANYVKEFLAEGKNANEKNDSPGAECKKVETGGDLPVDVHLDFNKNVAPGGGNAGASIGNVNDAMDEAKNSGLTTSFLAAAERVSAEQKPQVDEEEPLPTLFVPLEHLIASYVQTAGIDGVHQHEDENKWFTTLQVVFRNSPSWMAKSALELEAAANELATKIHRDECDYRNRRDKYTRVQGSRHLRIQGLQLQEVPAQDKFSQASPDGEDPASCSRTGAKAGVEQADIKAAALLDKLKRLDAKEQQQLAQKRRDIEEKEEELRVILHHMHDPRKWLTQDRLPANESHATAFFQFCCWEDRSDRDFVSKLVSAKGSSVVAGAMLEFLRHGCPQKIQDDAELVKKIVAVAGCALEYASPRCKAMLEICKIACKEDGDALEWCAQCCRNDVALVKVALNNCGCLRWASDAVRENEQVIKLALTENAEANLEWCPEATRKSRQLVGMAVANDACSVKFAADELKMDTAFLKKCITKDVFVLRELYPAFLDEEILMRAGTNNTDVEQDEVAEDYEEKLEYELHFSEKVRTFLKENRFALFQFAILEGEENGVDDGGCAIEWAPSGMRSDKELAKKVLASNGSALEHFSDSIKDDPELVKLAVAADGAAFEHASLRLRQDQLLAKIAVESDGQALQFASTALRDDKSVVKLAVKSYAPALEYASARLRDDIEVCRYAVKDMGSALEWCSEALRNDNTLVHIALKDDGDALEFANDQYKDDERIVMQCLKNHPWSLQHASERLRNDKTTVLCAVGQDGTVLEHASDAIRDDEEVCKKAVEQDGNALEFCSPRLRNNMTLVQIAVRHDKDAMCFASNEIKLKYTYDEILRIKLATGVVEQEGRDLNNNHFYSMK